MFGISNSNRQRDCPLNCICRTVNCANSKRDKLVRTCSSCWARVAGVPVGAALVQVCGSRHSFDVLRGSGVGNVGRGPHTELQLVHKREERED